jgi:hypothetical protein
MWSRAAQLEAAKIPNKNDKYLIGYHHPYDPSNFAVNGTGTYGTASDINATIAEFTQLTSWSDTNNIPVSADEMGAPSTADYNSRMIYYATMVEQAISNGESFNVWDDNGNYKTYLRSSRTWDDSKDVIIYTYKESPTQLKAVVKDNTITLTWLNRTALNDSIFVDRKTTSTDFTPISELSPTTSQFYDSALNWNSVYYYRLRTKFDSIDLYSYPIAVTINSHTTSINSLALVQKEFKVYPNPAINEVTVLIPESSTAVKLDIYNVMGVHIKTIMLNNKETSVSLNGFSNGVYIFAITSDNTLKTKQVIVNH